MAFMIMRGICFYFTRGIEHSINVDISIMAFMIMRGICLYFTRGIEHCIDVGIMGLGYSRMWLPYVGGMLKWAPGSPRRSND